MTTQDKHILLLFKALDGFGQTFGEGWLAEIKKQREWLETDIKKREASKSDALQQNLF